MTTERINREPERPALRRMLAAGPPERSYEQGRADALAEVVAWLRDRAQRSVRNGEQESVYLTDASTWIERSIRGGFRTPPSPVPSETGCGHHRDHHLIGSQCWGYVSAGYDHTKEYVSGRWEPCPLPVPAPEPPEDTQREHDLRIALERVWVGRRDPKGPDTFYAGVFWAHSQLVDLIGYASHHPRERPSAAAHVPLRPDETYWVAQRWEEGQGGVRFWHQIAGTSDAEQIPAMIKQARAWPYTPFSTGVAEPAVIRLVKRVTTYEAVTDADAPAPEPTPAVCEHEKETGHWADRVLLGADMGDLYWCPGPVPASEPCAETESHSTANGGYCSHCPGCGHGDGSNIDEFDGSGCPRCEASASPSSTGTTSKDN